MKSLLKFFVHFTVIVLILLWSYTALSKLMDFQRFARAMSNQPIPPEAGTVLLYLLPISELITGILLVLKKTERYGLMVSFVLMMAFTIYVGLTYFGYFQKHACACAGVFSHMGWGTHFIFNIGILLITTISLIIYRKEGRLQK